MHFTFCSVDSKSPLLGKSHFYDCFMKYSSHENWIYIESKFFDLKSELALFSSFVFFFFFIWSHHSLLSAGLRKWEANEKCFWSDYKTASSSCMGFCSYESLQKWIFDYTYGFMQVMICDVRVDQKSFPILLLQCRSNLRWKNKSSVVLTKCSQSHCRVH